VEYAAQGGLRSATLAFSIRALINLVLALIRIGKVPRAARPAVIRHALFGEDTWRFGAMVGSFTALYKFLLNALPILIPAINPRDKRPKYNSVEVSIPAGEGEAEEKARLRLTASAKLALITKRTRRWHAAMAGTIAGGLAIMCEKRGRRGVISQQMFVRGLQGSWNAFADAKNINIPYGDVMVFALACGQIVYAFLLQPDTLPRSYSSWMSGVCKVPMNGVSLNRTLVREHTIDFHDLDKLLARPDITPSNATYLTKLKDLFRALPTEFPTGVSPYTAMAARALPDAGDPDSWYFPFYGPCQGVHPTLSHCSSVPLVRFFEVFRMMLPIYGALHLVPAVLFKWGGFLRNPGRVVVRAGLGTARSSAFLGVFIVVYQSLFCYKNKFHRVLTLLRNSPTSIVRFVPQRAIDALISKASFWFPGFFAGLALLVEARRRRGELAMYALPKGLESAWVMARGKGWVFRTGKWGDVILTSVGMGMVMSAYQNDPQHLSGFVRRILYQFIGPN